ncbi:predicted protein [Plenodomus lingam JN3]|uniref:Predicted protein n=1 Tax=Leptosphaeria maculans (strain JN3 / isolate v23.1.3 / race Av1-4-5-6-7-8) TaxID=985895 RepID=E4ZVU4_LEPMJ|nr:predicted protein [Plenodomus lingam JN3]CBX95720.1 predicted protein [Plenodomus lingam JN3]
MPPKTTAPSASKDVLEDCIAVLMATGGSTSITGAQYDMMSSINGERTASSFQHQFRHIIAKSKELKQRLENGEEFPPVPPPKKSAPATPKKRKAAGQKETPNKKATPKKDHRKQDTQAEEQSRGDSLEAEDFQIKQEDAWGFV